MSENWPYSFNLGVVAEEIDDDPRVALPFVQQLGATHVEFGSLWGRRISEWSDAELQTTRDELERLGLQVAMIGPSTFKTVLLDHVSLAEIKDDPHFQSEMEVMRRTMELAHFFHAPLVRTFSFRREGMVGLGNPSPRLPRGGEISTEMMDKVRKGLGLICELAEKQDVDLGLENVRSCWANTGWNARRIVEAVGSPRLKMVWDPANAFVSGEEEAYPEGYAQVKPRMAHMHAKDARVVDPSIGLTAWERIGDGEVDYRGQMAALIQDGYTGSVSIETHYEPPGKTPAEATQLTTEGLLEILASISGRT